MFGKEPDKGVMEVFNDYNADLINLYRCVKNRTWELLQVLGFLPLNSRDEFMEIKSFLEMGGVWQKAGSRRTGAGISQSSAGRI